jgi:hypothetical protein
MSQNSLITQTQVPIPVIIGAYYDFVVNQGDQDGNQADPKDFEHSSNKCIVLSLPAIPRGPSVEDTRRFDSLVAAWHAERDITSSVTDMVTCPSYQKIIAMGDVAVPLILSRLRSEGNEPDHWFWALRVLADVDPVPEQDRGNIGRMSNAWLEWGRQQGYAG